MMAQIRAESINLLYSLSAELQVYDLSAIRQDLLKQLYQDLVDPETRHDLGEYYTPDWLAQLTLEEIDYQALRKACSTPPAVPALSCLTPFVVWRTRA